MQKDMTATELMRQQVRSCRGGLCSPPQDRPACVGCPPHEPRVACMRSGVHRTQYQHVLRAQTILPHLMKLP